ncbi:hypothetical protein M501DRAFT_988581 [Patellaria atrata CBS 101060]|uniref:SUZ domain-containing protein n=1 Tax=Patellaria atrata CBS 101060 TaxID=1346257 RepID=A0A9P4VQX2_9PEZI|nr:hypothetical protein M501DRAFT_988581 [Patellaria atrata CBS 101060]
MTSKSAVPDAWDDDWTAVADKPETQVADATPEAPRNITRAELRAQHAAANKQLWESAEAPESTPYLIAKNDPPVGANFKPQLKVLSRKPPPKIASCDGVASGIAGLFIEDDSEEEERKRNAEVFAERQAKAQKEREEKQRKYQEVRERLFGTSGTTSEENKGRSSPARDSSTGSRASRGKGRGRVDRETQMSSSADQSPVRPSSQRRQLYDPGYTPKPNSVYLQKRGSAEGRSRPETPIDDTIIRAPRGPDGSGRGGFGFAPRGNKSGPSV